jgi:hypothetical protein
MELKPRVKVYYTTGWDEKAQARGEMCSDNSRESEQVMYRVKVAPEIYTVARAVEERKRVDQGDNLKVSNADFENGWKGS